MMTLVNQADLDRLRQKQIMQAIQQPEVPSMAKLKPQIEASLNKSKLSDAEKMEDLTSRTGPLRQDPRDLRTEDLEN